VRGTREEGGVGVRLVRVFPRRTRATPDDKLAYVGEPDMFVEADEVHISVTFTYDFPEAERLEKEWRHVAPVKIGGPATGEPGGYFEPGRYIKKGYVITSRGCPNNCWFCSVPKREGALRELPIRDGWNVLDDNLLACSDEHIVAVFSMLKRQKHKAEFTGGLEAKRLKAWHCELLRALNPTQFFFAYDTEDDLGPLRTAGKMLTESGFPIGSHAKRCYVLVGYQKDTAAAAETRLRQSLDAGFLPMAMLYRDKGGKTEREWRRFQRQWARPAIIAGRRETLE
jgi:hypothetical protein